MYTLICPRHAIAFVLCWCQPLLLGKICSRDDFQIKHHLPPSPCSLRHVSTTFPLSPSSNPARNKEPRPGGPPPAERGPEREAIGRQNPTLVITSVLWDLFNVTLEWTRCDAEVLWCGVFPPVALASWWGGERTTGPLLTGFPPAPRRKWPQVGLVFFLFCFYCCSVFHLVNDDQEESQFF